MKTEQYNFRKSRKGYFIYITFILFLTFVHGVTLAQNKDNIYTKNISNSYKVSPKDALTIKNKFGQVTINSWDKNIIQIDVVVKAWGDDELDAKDILDKINIDGKRKEAEIYYETKFLKKYKNNKRTGFEINYEVKMPPYLKLNLENRFGATFLGDYDGAVSLISAYGSLKTKRLSGKQVEINVSYGKADIDELRYGYLKSSYCGYVNIKKAGNISVDDRNGNLDIKEVEEIEASSAYSNFNIGKLTHSLELDSKFGNASVKNISSAVQRIDIDISYGSADLDLNDVDDFVFDVDVSFGNFSKGSNNLNYRTQIEKPIQQNYEGSKGNGGTASIKVKAAYGNITF